MKRQGYTLVMFLFLIGSMAVAAQAQSGRSELRANIPFEFTVGNQHMAAGEYTVSQINPSSDRAVLQLRSKDGRDTAMIQMNDAASKLPASSRLVFNRYGDEYYFAQAWIAGETTGLQASPSKSEREARQELAGMKSQTETVALSRR